MHPQPRRELQNLLRQHGPGLVADPQRTEALLYDHCGEHQREIFVLVHAQRANIPAELSRMSGQRAEGAVRQRLAQRLKDRYAFSGEAAAWAVEAWADALNIRAVPVYQSWLLGLWHSLRGRVSRRIPPDIPPDTARSIFGGIGVQWGKVSARWLVLLLLVVALTTTALAARQGNWLAKAQFFAFGQGTPTPDIGRPSPSPAGAATALAVRYPPPLEARIEADLLNVRAAPTLDAEVLGKVGPQGANVTVDGFTTNGEWSHIAAPVDGWISNDFVTFASGNAEQRVYVQPALGQVVEAGLSVRGAPRADAPAIATLVAGQTLVLVAFSADGQWRQIVEPSPGWVQSHSITVMER